MVGQIDGLQEIVKPETEPFTTSNGLAITLNNAYTQFALNKLLYKQGQMFSDINCFSAI